MHTPLKTALGAIALACAGSALADVTFYESDNYAGRSFTVRDAVGDFRGAGFNDRASSVVVTGSPWEVCDDAGFHGHCYILRPGNYPSLSAMNLDDRISSARAMDRDGQYADNRWAPPPLPGEITVYEYENFQGRAFRAAGDVPNLRRSGLNDRASSITVTGERWEVCDDAGFGGRCMFLRPGNYPSLAAMGLNDRISSVRMVPPGMRVADNGWAPPPPQPAYDARPRPQEQLFQAQVLYSHAMYGAPEQRCWIEQREVRDNRGQVGGAVIGGILGGILGHQIGRGGGVVGAVGGAVVGGAIGSQNDGTRTTGVQRCGAAAPSGPPQFWDTAYSFRGQEHHVQTTAPPGPTITVNGYGEPRI
jgi:hypothetical protein